MENSGRRQRRERDSRGDGGMVGRVRSWVANSASGQRGDVEAGPPRTAQRSGAQSLGKKNAAAARKGRGDSGGVRVTPPGDSCMVPQVTNSSVGGVTRLGRMVGTAAMKTTGSRGASPRKAP